MYLPLQPQLIGFGLHIDHQALIIGTKLVKFQNIHTAVMEHIYVLSASCIVLKFSNDSRSLSDLKRLISLFLLEVEKL